MNAARKESARTLDHDDLRIALSKAHASAMLVDILDHGEDSLEIPYDNLCADDEEDVRYRMRSFAMDALFEALRDADAVDKALHGSPTGAAR